MTDFLTDTGDRMIDCSDYVKKVWEISGSKKSGDIASLTVLTEIFLDTEFTFQ